MDKIKHYEIAEQLGDGKHGPTFLAMDTGHQRAVVIKRLDHPATRTDEWKNRYRARLQQLIQIDDPRLTKYHSLEETDGYQFIVREYIEGQSLTEWLRSDLPGPAQIMEIALDLATQLKALHDRSLVHGNITAANVIIGTRGGVRLVDGGLGLASETETRHPPMPADEMVYLAPELLAGEDPGPYSDQYALGTILYLMWTGQPIFPDDDPETLRRSIVEEPVSFELHPAREVPGVSRLLINKLLAKLPDERFVSTDELLFTLQGMISLGSAPEPAATRKKWSPPPRLYLLMSVLTALLVILWLVITSDNP